MLYRLLLFLFLILQIVSALSMDLSHSIIISVKGDKTIPITQAWLTQEIAQQLQNEPVRQWFRTLSPEFVFMLIKFCNFVRMESKVNAQFGMTKFVTLDIRFEDMPEFLKTLVILSLPQKIITEAIRYYVEKASNCMIYLNNYQFHTDPERDRAIKLEIAKWYFLKYDAQLAIPQGTSLSLSVRDLLEAEKKIPVTTYCG